jgi:hypothetical protein
VSSGWVIVRFPWGSEFTVSENVSEDAPKVGDVFNRREDDWVVVEVLEDLDRNTFVTMRPSAISALARSVFSAHSM